MSMIKVAKFGGSSLANAKQFTKVAAIVRAEPSRRYVVVSAPGKAPGLDEKVTDMLYACQAAADEGQLARARALFLQIQARYEVIMTGLGIEAEDILRQIQQVGESILAGSSADYAASRGEYLNGLIMAKYLDYAFVDPAQGICFAPDGQYDAELTQRRFGALLKDVPNAVIPGFYGAFPDGHIKTFSRGGSDITGAIVARVVKANVYENWTDVSGFLMADPRIVPDAQSIDFVTYRELRELSYMGATVLHEDSIFPVREAGIPIQVRNTNDPAHPGTMIVAKCPDTDGRPITGIAGHKGFTIFHIEKGKMNHELGFGRRVLTIFERHGVLFEHLPTGIDTMSVVVAGNQIDGQMQHIIQDIQTELQPDILDLQGDLALIATVGQGMISRVGVSATLFRALADAGVNVRMIDQGSSELNIIVGVDVCDFEVAVRAIYAAFVQ